MKLFNFLDVVRYDGPESRNVLAWRHPNTELRLGTTLQVTEGQTAVLMSNGRIVESYGPGKHRIDGNNVQVLQSVKKAFTGGVNPDTTTLWFVNTVEIPPISWGTPTRQAVRVPTGSHGRAVTAQVGARGTFSVRVRDLETLLREFVLSQPDQITMEVLQGRFRQECLQVVTDAIARAFVDLNIPFDTITARKTELAGYLLPQVAATVGRLGFDVVGFRVDDVNLDEKTLEKIVRRQDQREDAYEAGQAEVDAALGSTQVQRMQADADLYSAQQEARGEMAFTDARVYSQEREGYSYQDRRRFDVLEEAAANPGMSSTFTQAGMGMAMGVGIGGQMGSVFGEAMGRTAQSGLVAALGGLDGSATDAGGPGDAPGPQAGAPEGVAVVAQPLTGSPTPSGGFCRECGSPMGASDKFCGQCGTRKETVS